MVSKVECVSADGVIVVRTGLAEISRKNQFITEFAAAQNIETIRPTVF